MYFAIIFAMLGGVLFLSVLIAVVVLTLGRWTRIIRLTHRDTTCLTADFSSFVDPNRRLLALYLLEEIAKAIGVNKAQLLLSDRFDNQLAYFCSRRVQLFAELLDLGWRGVKDDVTLRMRNEGFECDLELNGSINDCINRAVLNNTK